MPWDDVYWDSREREIEAGKRRAMTPEALCEHWQRRLGGARNVMASDAVAREITAGELQSLLALAREALERRRDAAALDDDPDPEDTARQERLDSLLYHPPVPKDPY